MDPPARQDGFSSGVWASAACRKGMRDAGARIRPGIQLVGSSSPSSSEVLAWRIWRSRTLAMSDFCPYERLEQSPTVRGTNKNIDPAMAVTK